jgi:ATP-dependent RNA helicase SUPV3L1/SUV3
MQNNKSEGPKALANSKKTRQAQPAIVALAALGIQADHEGRTWRRVIQGALELEAGEPTCQASIKLEGNGRPPSIDPSDAEQAQIVVAWFDQSMSREEALNKASQLYVEAMAKARMESLEDADRLGKRLRKALGEGFDLTELSEEIKAAHAQWRDNWRIKRQAGELERRLSLDAYPLLFPLARSMMRKVEIFTGPTNSGKTYAGMQLLSKAGSGAYLAPLRLLAMEGQEAMIERGISCSLVTGEERRIDPQAHFVASTVEMADFSEPIEAAVIDEAQMLADKDRGWAWTAAICGLPAKHLAIVCAPEAVEMVKALLARTGEPCVVHEFKRKTPLEAQAQPVSESRLIDGDAIIAFSRKNALMWRDTVAAQGKTVAVIYGALAPEVRRSEAKRFADGSAQVLVATDAIGMGLNLPIKRVVFSTASKFDGQETRELTTQELRQIAGRAGRYGIAERGFAAAMCAEDAKLVAAALSSGVQMLFDKASICPNDRQVELMSKEMGTDKLVPMLCFFRDHLVKSDQLFKASSMEDMIDLAWKADRRLGLNLSTRFAYAKTPLDRNDLEHVKSWESWMRAHEQGQRVRAPVSPMAPKSAREDDRLWEAERAMKLLSAYCWLSWRFEDIFTERSEAEKARAQLSERIEAMLAKAGAAQAKKSHPTALAHKGKAGGNGGAKPQHKGRGSKRGR